VAVQRLIGSAGLVTFSSTDLDLLVRCVLAVIDSKASSEKLINNLEIVLEKLVRLKLGNDIEETVH